MSTQTTHDPHGGGRPRLIFAFGGIAETGSQPREFDLVPGVTAIGSGPDNDLRLDGLDERHAEIRRDETDEYVYVDLGSTAGSRIDGQPAGDTGDEHTGARQEDGEQAGGWALHTGDRLELGKWTLSYYREEFADHGRPHTGRQGGEPFQLTQDEPRPRGTSPGGGSEPTATDPGEYF